MPMDCKTATPLLHAYLDGELDRRAVDEVESHLESCRDCASQLGVIEAVRKVVREGAPRYKAPASLRARLQSSEESSQPERQAYRANKQQWWAMAASLVVAFVLGAGTMRLHTGDVAGEGAQQAFVHDLLASHLRALAATSPVDVVSSNRHTVKPWFAGKVGQSPPVRDFAAEGFPLVGGRIDYVGDQRIPVLAYSHGPHLIDVYMLMPAPGDSERSLQQVRGYRVAPARIQDHAAWIVSDVDEQEFLRFRQLLESSETVAP
jgi:mycothiol system anti-sigma-R factor